MQHNLASRGAIGAAGDLEFHNPLPVLRLGGADKIAHGLACPEPEAEDLVDVFAGTSPVFGQGFVAKPLDVTQLRSKNMQEQRADGGFALAGKRHLEQLFAVLPEPMLPALPLFPGISEAFVNPAT